MSLESAEQIRLLLKDVLMDQDAALFFGEILEDMVSRFGITQEDAAERIVKACAGRPPGRGHLLPGPDAFVGNHLIYHEAPEYWSQSVYHGRRDFWRKP